MDESLIKIRMKTNTQTHRRFEIAAKLLILFRLTRTPTTITKTMNERKMKAKPLNQKRSNKRMTSEKSQIVPLIDETIEQMIHVICTAPFC